MVRNPHSDGENRNKQRPHVPEDSGRPRIHGHTLPSLVADGVKVTDPALHADPVRGGGWSLAVVSGHGLKRRGEA